MSIRVLTFLVLILPSCIPLSAQVRQEPVLQAPGMAKAAPAGFEENKGQVITTDGAPAPFVRYRLSQGNTNIFLLEDGIAYQFSRSHLPEGYMELKRRKGRDVAEQAQLEALEAKASSETYRMDMELEGANAHASITTEGRSADYTNYYNHDALDVRTFSKVTYHEVYPGIDWVIRSTAQGMEHDFVLRPGADPSPIKMRFKDHEELFLDAEGNLTHGNRLGRFMEERPVSYQGAMAIATRFVLEGDVLSFDVGVYDKARELVIDPARLWGTFYGGTSDEFGFACAADADGNVYLAGTSSSTNAIASVGAHQTALAAQDDGMLVKFNSNGVRQWGTYYGGSGSDAFWGCTVDEVGNVFGAGWTTSQANISFSGHQNSHGGGTWDAMLVKFNSTGTREWATYYGGSQFEQGICCAVDASGNVYMSGSADNTTANVIASVGAHQSSYGGSGDAFLVKFDAFGTRLWGTYYGGSGLDVGNSCAADQTGNVILAGTTGSTNGNSIAIAGHQNTFGGVNDAFLVKFNSSGVRQWGTYYGGSYTEFGYSCAVDLSGNAFLAGHTLSYNGISVITAHQSAMGSDVDAFLVKFSPSGTRVWGTYYGGNGTEDARSCQTDTDGNVYLAGESGSTNNIAYQGHQNTLGGGGGDAFLAKFTPSGVRIFGTYYGGTDVDRSYACAVDASGNVFLAGQVLSTEVDAISESGHQNTPGGANDAFLVKFGDLLDCAGVPNGTALPGTACDDHDECTINDAWSADCACSGTLLDSDGDGVCDFNDACPGGLEPGTPCDDGNELTLDDVVGPNCACTGSPASCLVNGDCNDNDDCTTDACVSNACVFTPLALDGIIGPTSVISLSSNFWEVDPVPGDFIYTWVLPGDWVSPGINGQSVEATVGENLGWQQICVNAFDGACSLDQCLDVFVDEFLSIEDFHWEGSASNLYSVWQDPGTDRIDLLPGKGISGRVRFTVFDATGRMLQTTSADGDPHPITFDMSGTATGVYLLHITQGPRTQVAKLLIDR